ncbi:DUF3106 domain-containing protein [Luteimonas salinilitoris]|uniref:DUF3106 domain-containing protein n=1 Tax=Luteimonas salinilitoris TaxID=3237697 RepID=A0ABV4HUY1_9GAMM
MPARPLFAIALSLLLVLPAASALPPALQRYAQALPEPERARLLQRQATLRALPPAEREALRRRVAEWDALPLAERRQRRNAWAAWQALRPEAQARLRAAARAYAELPTDRQQALNERYAELDSYQRDGWLLGPELGADWTRLHGLFALVPADDRAPLLAALRAMDERERADLALLAQRTPPEERDALRRALLSTPPEGRAAWLRRQVGPAP